MPGNSIPYTDDPDGYDPTDALTVYSLPKLDPTVNNSNAPQDQSAALLDPSAFQPAANIGILGPVTPPGATTLTTPDGTPFYAPAGADFDQIYAAGEKSVTTTSSRNSLSSAPSYRRDGLIFRDRDRRSMETTQTPATSRSAIS
jgi:hypothetical protein